MASLTLAESAKRVTDEIVRGVAEDIIDLNPWFQVMPFSDFDGNSLTVTRENTLGDSGKFNVGDTITAVGPSIVDPITFQVTSLIGIAQLNHLVQGQASSSGVDHAASEISSKAKSIGRDFQAGIATGTGVLPEINSFHTEVDASQFTAASAGQALSFELLNELTDLVLSKDGQVDFIMMPKRTIRAYKTLLRAQGGSPADEVITMPDAITDVLAFENIPVFRNDFLSITETANGAALTGGSLTSIYAGVFDDGTQRVGVSGLTPSAFPAGIQVTDLGETSDKDEKSWRIVQYTNFASFNRRGVARLTSINN